MIDIITISIRIIITISISISTITIATIISITISMLLSQAAQRRRDEPRRCTGGDARRHRCVRLPACCALQELNVYDRASLYVKGFPYMLKGFIV